MRRGRLRIFTTAQCAELWRRYKTGETVQGIGRALGGAAATVRRELQYTGGIAPARRLDSLNSSQSTPEPAATEFP